MSPEEARQLIGLEGDFSPEELEEALRRRSQEMEIRIERAPTPGLKEKYRRNLAQIKEAWEVLNGNAGSFDDVDLNLPKISPTVSRKRPEPPPATTEGDAPVTTRDLGTPEAKRGLGLILTLSLLSLFLVAWAVGYWGYWLPKQEAEAKAASDAAAQQAAARAKSAEEVAALEKARQDAEARAAAAEQAAQKAKADADKAKEAEQAAAAQAKAEADQKAAAAGAAQAANYPKAGQPWTNSLGMKFVPAGTDGVLFCIWDVRVEDYQEFITASGHDQTGGINVMKVKKKDNGSYSLSWGLDLNASWQSPGFDQGPTHPVVGVSWNDAKAFCDWLTTKEQGEGKLGPGQSYRLPYDLEWGKAVGDGKYPWGDVWPPPEGAGNYGDEAFAGSLPGTGWTHVPGNDGYARTSPVGSFRPSAYGLYDMGGNVWQWCEDWYQASMNTDEIKQKIPALNNDGGGSTYKVLRGASWFDLDPRGLLSSSRSFDLPGYRGGLYGFRVVVVVSP